LPESADPGGRGSTPGHAARRGRARHLVFAIIDAESAGFGAAVVIILLCASAVLFAGVRLVGAPRPVPAA
jgi:hypothetical protein